MLMAAIVAAIETESATRSFWRGFAIFAMPKRSDHQTFMLIGQNCSVLLVACLGGLVGRFVHLRARREP
jgi:hypothetical protein